MSTLSLHYKQIIGHALVYSNINLTEAIWKKNINAVAARLWADKSSISQNALLL